MKILLLGKNGQIGWELQRSLAAVWHPCTQMKQHAAAFEALPLIPIARGEGVAERRTPSVPSGRAGASSFTSVGASARSDRTGAASNDFVFGRFSGLTVVSR